MNADWPAKSIGETMLISESEVGLSACTTKRRFVTAILLLRRSLMAAFTVVLKWAASNHDTSYSSSNFQDYSHSRLQITMLIYSPMCV